MKDDKREELEKGKKFSFTHGVPVSGIESVVYR